MSIQHLLDARAIVTLAIDPKTGEPRKMTTAHRLALMAIADDASDHTNLSYPGFGKICDWAMVKERRGHELVQDLISAGYVHRERKAHTGQRTLYRVDLPPRPRPQPVDNPGKEGAVQRRLSEKRVRSGGREGAAHRTPLPINSSGINQSSTESHHSARAAARMTGVRATILSFAPHLNLDQVLVALAPAYPQLADDADFPPSVEKLAAEILLRGDGKVKFPTRYVTRSLLQDPELQQRLYDLVGGGWPE